jgi:hypothetical protein
MVILLRGHVSLPKTNRLGKGVIKPGAITEVLKIIPAWGATYIMSAIICQRICPVCDVPDF